MLVEAASCGGMWAHMLLMSGSNEAAGKDVVDDAGAHSFECEVGVLIWKACRGNYGFKSKVSLMSKLPPSSLPTGQLC